MENKENNSDMKICKTANVITPSSSAEQGSIKVSIDSEINKLADLLANLIEKYADKIDLDNLPEPERSTGE